MKDYNGTTFFYHSVSPNETFSLIKLFEICLLPKPDDNLSLEDTHNFFIERFQQNDVHLILDDYYEIQDEDVKLLLPKLIAIGKGKVLILSRVIPSQVSHLTNEFWNYKILSLPEPEFKQIIQNYINAKNVYLSESDIHLIFEKAQGYPLGGQLIIDAKPYSATLGELLSDLPQFEAELDPDGKSYSGRLLDRIFQKGNNEEITLLCEFSALFGASDIETIRELPSYNLHAFEGLHRRKSFVDMDAQGKFSSHAMIKDFAYYRLKNRKDLHLKLGIYFESKIIGRTDDDWKWLNEAILHYTRADKDELLSFKQRVERKFESRNIKGLIEKNRINTIRNYVTLINLYPDKPAYYNELGIAYRLNNQRNNAIETFERALEIEPSDLPSLNELGITYRENNQKTKAIETFERALEIEPKHLPSLNELGITYRENNQKTKAIETFERALEIEPKHLPSLNELGITYRENNQKTKAIETFERALEIEPKHLPSLNELGITYRENNQKTKAIETFERALEIEPSDLPFLNELGITYRENNQKTKAIETFERALEIEPSDLPSLNELGITYRENNQIDEAIAICRRAISISRQRQSNLNLLQIYLFFKPDKQKAKEHYDLLMVPPRLHAFNSSRKKYESIILDIESILSVSFDEFKRYESFLFLAIQYKSYVNILPLLEKLNMKNFLTTQN